MVCMPAHACVHALGRKECRHIVKRLVFQKRIHGQEDRKRTLESLKDTAPNPPKHWLSEETGRERCAGLFLWRCMSCVLLKAESAYFRILLAKYPCVNVLQEASIP